MCKARLHASRETDQVGANTEAGTRAGGRADGGGIDIEDGKDGEGSQGDRADLIHTELLAREQVARNGDGEALEGILDQALDEVGNINSHGRGGGGLC
jgi:hypothetical protein